MAFDGLFVWLLALHESTDYQTRYYGMFPDIIVPTGTVMPRIRPRSRRSSLPQSRSVTLNEFSHSRLPEAYSPPKKGGGAFTAQPTFHKAKATKPPTPANMAPTLTNLATAPPLVEVAGADADAELA